MKSKQGSNFLNSYNEFKFITTYLAIYKDDNRYSLHPQNIEQFVYNTSFNVKLEKKERKKGKK